ncbi:MAG TPA: 2-oxo-tetronate isomerase [Caulobacteraceae bacterium]|jgi:hydroxypyruvate isomerase
MPDFAANLSFLFNEWDFLDRFQAAADSGFTAVEYLFPYDHAPDEIARRLESTGLTQALFNLPPGDWVAGERGLAALPGRMEEVQAGLELALPYIEATKVGRVHMMAGIADWNDPLAMAAYRRSLAHVAGRLAEVGVDLMIEPINRIDMPGYFLDSVDNAAGLIPAMQIPNLKLQFDIYHCQIIHGDVTRRLRRLLPLIGHVQIASVPSRNEPDGEELNYPFLFQELDLLGYAGFVGCEYRPRGKTVDGLDWFTGAGARVG